MTETQSLVSVIVANYNGREWLDNFFSSLFCQTHQNLEVIFVDNNSSDDSVEYVLKNFPTVKVVQSQENRGYAGGNNLGIKHATGEYIMITNNDVVYDKDVVEKLLVAFRDIPKLGCVQPKYCQMNDPAHLDACGSFWTNTGFNYHYGIYKDQSQPEYNRSFPIYSVKGVCMMVSKSLVDKIGLFDEDFWCYFEETDFCHRVWLSGYECWYYPKAKLLHFNGGTRLKKAEAFIQFHSFKNRLCSYFMNLGVWEMVKVLPVYLLLNIVWSLAHLLKFDLAGCAVVYRAFWWNIKNLGKIMKKRQHVQKEIRKVSDKQIFAKVRRNPRLSYYYYYLLKGLQNYAD